MKGLLGLFFRPKGVLVLILLGFLLIGYQNCQSGGSTFTQLGSECQDCGGNTGGPNPDLLVANIDHGGDRRIEVDRGFDSLMIVGGCSKAGFEQAFVTVTLSRNTTNRQQEVSCIGGGFQANFTGLSSAFQTSTNFTNISVSATIKAIANDGSFVYPTLAAPDTALIVFNTPVPTSSTTTTTIPPSVNITVSIGSFASTQGNARRLKVFTYYYPQPSQAVNLLVTATHVSSGRTLQQNFVNFNGFQQSLAELYFDDNDAAVTNVIDHEYRVSVIEMGTGRQDVNVTFKKSSDANRFTDIQAGTPVRVGPSGNPPFPANSVAIPIGLLDNNTMNPVPIMWQYRVLSDGMPWSTVNSDMTVNASNQGNLVLTSQMYNMPNTKLILYRFYRNNTFSTAISNGL